MAYEVEELAAAEPYVGPKPMLLWTDPPFGTGKVQAQRGNSFRDDADSSLVVTSIVSWLPRLHTDATVVVCCDYRLAPVLVTAVVSAGWTYRGEVIWEFGLGRPRTSWWPVRHNNLLTFTRTPTSGRFDARAVPQTKRLSPKPGYGEHKPAGSVWDYTMNNTSAERAGYPNQKPLVIIEPFVLAHTQPGDLVCDPFCGSGSTGVSALGNNRNFYGRDTNPRAVALTLARLIAVQPKVPA